MKRRKHIDLRSTDALVILVPVLCPVLALIHGLIGSGTWHTSLDAWRGGYVHPVLGVPMYTWEELLPTLGGLLLGYIVSLVLALGIARSINRNSPFYRLRLIIGIGLAVVGALAFFCSMVYASLAYLFFIDLRLGGIISPNSTELMIALTLIVFLADAYYLIKASADSSNKITRQAPTAD
jgi:hypothetical protein